jgi:hypothetical protein
MEQKEVELAAQEFLLLPSGRTIQCAFVGLVDVPN